MASNAGRANDIVPSTGSDEPEQSLVEALKALAHPIRLRIMQVLADKQRFGLEEESCCAEKEVCVCRLNELFDVAPPTMSHHLKLLREAGLIEGRRNGVWIYYSIRSGSMDSLLAALEALRVGV